MIVHYKNQLRYEKEKYKFSSNESLVSALEYNFLTFENDSLIKMKKQRHSVTIAVTTITLLSIRTWTIASSTLPVITPTEGSGGNGMHQLL